MSTGLKSGSFRDWAALARLPNVPTVREMGFPNLEQQGWNGYFVPARTPESDAMSKDLARRGFNFIGSTICYAFMQAVGMVNDHMVDCYRHKELGG